MKKVLITGANGFIGQWVIKLALAQPDIQVIAVDLEDAKFPDERVIYKKMDLLTNAKSPDLYEKCGSPDIVIHLAWQDGFKHNAESHLDNLPNHFAFLKNMIDSGCNGISAMGSMHEVGYYEGMVTADTPCNPLSLYAVAKNALRQAVMAYSQEKSVSVKWLRAFYILGDEEKSPTVFGKIYRMAKEGKKTFPFTTGLNKYDFLNIEVLAQQIVAASLQMQHSGVIHCCSGEAVSLKDKVDEFIKTHHLTIKPEYGAFPSRKYDSPAIWGDASLINKIMSV